MDGEKETNQTIVIAMKPVHRLQIRPTVHNYRVPPTTPQVTCGSVQWCGNAARDRQTDTHTHTDGRDQYTFRLGYASRAI